MRPAQMVYILFFSVMYSTMLRAAEDWRPFPTHFFALPEPGERHAAGRRLALAIATLNLGPFAYFAGTLYTLGYLSEGTGWLRALHFFAMPWMALAVPGFFMLFRGFAVWGGAYFYGDAWERVRRQVVPHASPWSHLVPGFAYIVAGAIVLGGLMLL